MPEWNVLDSSDGLQELAELLRSLGPVADLVLFGIAHFRKGLGIAFGHEDGVVAEAGRSFPCLDNLTFDDAFEQMFLSVDDQGEDGAELCLAVLYAFQVMKQLLHVGFGVVGIACIAGRVDAWRSVQRFHFEAGIVGKAVQVVIVINVSCLYQGVSCQGISCLGNVCLAVDVLHAEKFYLVT